MTTMSVVGECFFWYRLTRVVPDNFHRAVKRLCVCVCVWCTDDDIWHKWRAVSSFRICRPFYSTM